MILTFVINVILALSFRKDFGVSFSYYSIILLQVRQTFRLLDFENTKPYMTAFDWNSLMIKACISNTVLIPIMSIMFNNYKYNKVYMSACFVYTIICTLIGICDTLGFEELIFMLINIPLIIVNVAIVVFVGRHIPGMLELIVKKGNENKKFK